MIPVIIGAAVGAAAYKLLEDKHEKNFHEETSTRYLSEEEVPPEILEEIQKKQLAHQKNESLGGVYTRKKIRD